jgi:hypothetical protein
MTGASIETTLELCACPSDNEYGFVWRSILPLSLSYDHRVINGADAARFALAVGAHINGIKFTSIGRPAAGRGLSSSEGIDAADIIPSALPCTNGSWLRCTAPDFLIDHLNRAHSLPMPALALTRPG